jgi:hypothetical protein
LKKLLNVLTLVIVFYPGLAAGQMGYISLHPDSASYIMCEMQDRAPGLVSIYAVHKFTIGATSSRFRVTRTAGFAMTYVDDSSPFVTAGNSQTGICIDYGQCQTGDFLVLTMRYFGTGTSATCSSLEVTADPASASGEIEMMGCDDVVYFGLGRYLNVNNDGSCDCWCLSSAPSGETVNSVSLPLRSTPGARSLCPTSPVQHETWGHIKALYN